MFKLIKLEIEKFRLSGYLKRVIIANLIILGFLFMAVYVSKTEIEMPFNNYNNVALFTRSFVTSTFLIFAAVLISRIIIGEYKNKTINILFMYPISRKKIMLAKYIIVVIFTFTTIVLSSLFLNFSVFILNIFVDFIKVPLTQDIIVKNLINIIAYSASFAFISLIPVYIGMRKKSGSATIVTSVILVSLLSSGSNGNSLSSIFIIQIILAMVGVVAAYLSIKDIEKVDVVNF